MMLYKLTELKLLDFICYRGKDITAKALLGTLFIGEGIFFFHALMGDVDFRFIIEMNAFILADQVLLCFWHVVRWEHALVVFLQTKPAIRRCSAQDQKGGAEVFNTKKFTVFLVCFLNFASVLNYRMNAAPDPFSDFVLDFRSVFHTYMIMCISVGVGAMGFGVLADKGLSKASMLQKNMNISVDRPAYLFGLIITYVIGMVIFYFLFRGHIYSLLLRVIFMGCLILIYLQPYASTTPLRSYRSDPSNTVL